MAEFVKAKGSSIQGQLRKIYQIRKYLSIEACKSITRVLIISWLDYCSSLLLYTKQSNVKYLQRLQDSAAQLVYQAHYRESATVFRLCLHWLPENERIVFINLTYVFKCLNSNAPVYLTEPLELSTPIRVSRSPTKPQRLVEPFIHNEMESRAFSITIPFLCLWNNLDEHIKLLTSSVMLC